jgi:hypothetical protein
MTCTAGTDGYRQFGDFTDTARSRARHPLDVWLHNNGNTPLNILSIQIPGQGIGTVADIVQVKIAPFQDRRLHPEPHLLPDGHQHRLRRISIR